MLPSLKAIEEQDLVLLARFTPNERGFEEIHAVIRFSTIPSFPSFLGNFLPAGSRQGHKTCAPFFFFFPSLYDLLSYLLLGRELSTTVSQEQHYMSRSLQAENSPIGQVANPESSKPKIPRRDIAANLYNAKFELDRTLFTKA